MNPQTWINERTIFKGLVGSRAYGLHNEHSDFDYRGVAIPPKDYFFGLHHFEQLESKKPDSCIFDIRKFFKLCLEGNPNLLEFLWLDDENVLKRSYEWNRILANKELFLSKRVKHRYLGYAYSQLKRVKSHRHWLLHPVEAKPTRTQFGLPEATSLSNELIGSIEMVIKQTMKDNLSIILDDAADDIAKINIRNYVEFDLREVLDEVFTDFVYPTVFNKLSNKIDVIVALGEKQFSDEILAVYTREKMYDSAMNNYKQYQEWKKKRNPERAIIEEKFGFDTKHVGHVFRLLIQGEQLLTEGKLDVKLKPDYKAFIMNIKNGVYAYDEVLGMAEERMKGFDTLYNNSTLPHSPDFNRANDLLVNIVECYLAAEG